MINIQLITRNPGLKVISLVLAIILWLFIRSETGGEVGIVAPFEFHGLSSNLIVTRVSEETINVRINGSLSQLERLSTKEVRARIDLSGAKPGLNSFDILPRNITVPQGLAINQISPSSIKVELDQVIDKIVRIEALVQGKPQNGYRVTRITVDPLYIKLQGARTQLMTLKKVSTEEVDISGLRETVKLEVPLKLTGLNLKRGVDRRVRIMVEIQKEDTET